MRPKRKNVFKRLNLELSQRTADRLERLVEMTDADSKKEVIRRALEFYEYYHVNRKGVKSNND